MIYGPASGFKTIQVRLYQICHFPDMYTIHKRMVYLDGKWQFYPAVLFVESSPVKQRDGIVAAAGIRMGNMGKGYPGERGKLEYVIAHGAGKIFLLVPHCFGGKGHVFLQGILHVHIDYFKQFRIRNQVCE